MNIQKATTAAMAIDGFVFREAWERHSRLEPSNFDGGYIVHTKYSEAPRPRWQPKAEDLMADDWEVSADLGGLVKVIPSLSELEKERLLAFGEGMAFKAEQQKTITPTAQRPAS